MPRATGAVGRNVLRKEGASKVIGRRAVHRRPVVPRPAARAHDSLDDSRGRDRRHPLRLRHRRLHHRRLPRHPGPQHRRAHRRRPAVPGRARDPPRRGADPAAGARGSRDAARGRRADRLSRRRRRSTIRRRRRRVFKAIAIDKGDLDDGFAARRRRSSKASTGSGHQEQLYIEPNGVIAVPDGDGRRHHGVRIDAVPVLRAPRADGAARPARRQGPRRADGDRRRLRRQGRIPVDDRRPRRAARAGRPGGR